MLLGNSDSPFVVHGNLPRNRKILVCGALRDLCVSIQCEVLLSQGFNAFVYGDAVVASLF